jgi:hypothetical protein
MSAALPHHLDITFLSRWRFQHFEQSLLVGFLFWHLLPRAGESVIETITIPKTDSSVNPLYQGLDAPLLLFSGIDQGKM